MLLIFLYKPNDKNCLFSAMVEKPQNGNNIITKALYGNAG